jgi:hypothetical protein
MSQSQQAQSQQTQTRGPRIFSHFGLTKPPSNVRGDAQIHPAVLRVGLQFAAFKIVGANARCIATLTALKNVSLPHVTYSFPLSILNTFVPTAGHTRLLYAAAYNSSPTLNTPHLTTDLPHRRSTTHGCQYGCRHSTAEARNQRGGYRSS